MMSIWDDITGFLTGGSSGGDINWTRTLLSLGGGYALSQSGAAGASAPPTGYQGGIPRYTPVRQAVNVPYDPNRRPGSAGQRYFSTQQFVPDEGGDIGAANAAATQEAAGLASLAQLNPARAARAAPIQRQPQGSVSPIVSRAPARVIEDRPIPQPQGFEGFQPRYAAGGIAHLAGGGRYLAGTTDGMEDRVRANIEGQQEARLSDGEFVIPADVVSHLGNGNSTAGAKRLDDMMAQVRQARTGTPKQGRQIDARKFMPK